MLINHLDELLMHYNFIDDVCVIDNNGIIVINQSFIQGAYSFNSEDTIGKLLTDVYPSEKNNPSTMMRVLKTQKPIFNQHAAWKTYTGDIRSGVFDTLPIYENGTFAGVMEVAKFTDFDKRPAQINLRPDIGASSRLYTTDDIITHNASVNALKKQIRKVSNYNSSVMIYGETGTGKEVFAQSIHSCSFKKDAPFISQNCSAIPDTLVESVLFGTEKGGFTGAISRKGVFELANGGTLFLDELNSMNINAQSKILKAIEEQKILRVGGKTYIPINVRIISAMNSDPIKDIKEGRLRSDLFYRLSTVLMHLPPLRERGNDLALLIDYFFKDIRSRLGLNIEYITPEAMEILQNYTWPGNIRELKNVIESSMIMAESDHISYNDIPEYVRKSYGSTSLSNSRTENSTLTEKTEQYEKQLILAALREHKSKSDAAESLGISRQLLNHKINKYNLCI